MKTFDAGYKAQLLGRYPADIVANITDDLQHAPIAGQSGQTVPYVYVRGHNVPEGAAPLLYVPGFGEGIINKASFAAELAVRGADVILPGQNRHGILRDAAGRRSAVHSQAVNYLSVLDHATAGGGADIMAHSYGALIFESMATLQPERFADSHAVLLAPAGTIEDERVPRLMRRWVAMMLSEMDTKRPNEFPDTKGVTGKASLANLFANIPRTLHEVNDLANRRVNYSQLRSHVGSLTVMSYAEDAMYPTQLETPVLAAAVESGVAWATPISPEKVVSGEMTYGGHGAVHDDEQYNPSRVARAVLNVVRPAYREIPSLAT